jgi:hypothetical protein
VKADVPDGTEIINSATIYFPSVPQTTRTNPVVSVVTPPGQLPTPYVGSVQLWAGLKNSDDQGTSFDVRAEVYADDRLIAQGETLCVSGLTRNAAKARPVLVPMALLGQEPVVSGAAVSLRVLARIGTMPDGARCRENGHQSAAGLRVYYDALSWASRAFLGLGSAPVGAFYLRSVGGARVLDAMPPAERTAETVSSRAVRFSGGNPWAEVGRWGYVAP